MHENARANRAAALLSVASNTVLMIAKLIVGLLTGSVAVLSDAANSGGDLVASGIAFAGVRAAARPADHDHPYGHEKTENLAALIEGVLVLLAGAVVAVEAGRRLVDGSAGLVGVDLAVAVMVFSAVANLAVSARLRRVARRTGSPAIEADAAHLASDVWTSGGAAVGLVIVAATGWTRVDAVVGVAISLYVIWIGARLAWRAAQVLLDTALPPEEMQAIEVVLAGFSRDEDISFHALRGRRAGSKRHVDLHMVVPPDTTVRNGHAMSGRVKTAVRDALPNTEVLIHLEDH
ncbi:cation diffusion facilitator family transporter [Miltoncostaea oceani]|uniref:cation diffusion facilitator family transporter n=1 Tax=Miltoncostaea oceani TaxID=2843216 RepID=UPI001C3D8459|nr:cation diffusion facilitator family transporter [Miltoncostaea oceani]